MFNLKCPLVYKYDKLIIEFSCFREILIFAIIMNINMKSFYSKNKITIIGYFFLVVCSLIFTMYMSNQLRTGRILTAQYYILFVWNVKIYLIYIVKNMFFFLWGIITASYALFLFILPMYAKIKFKKHVPLVKKAIHESETLRNPLTLFTDSQLINFKNEYEDTFRCTQKLLCRFLKKEVKDDCRIFILRYSKIEETKKWNNKWYREFKSLAEFGKLFFTEKQRVMHIEHYFTGSDKDNLKYSHKLMICEYKKIIDSDTEFGKYYIPYKMSFAKDYIDLDVHREIEKSIQFVTDIEKIRKRHNNNFVNNQLNKNKHFFDTVLAYPLDEQQRHSIVELEDNALVVSAAGGGKTSTMVGKVKYLIEKCKTDPSKILLLTYSRKAANELTQRLGYVQEGLRCYTFHKLALDIVSDATGKRPTVADSASLINNSYEQLIRQSEYLKAVNKFFLVDSIQTRDEFEYTAEQRKDYYADRNKYGIMCAFTDMDRNIIYTKSEQERKIVHFLTIHGINFRYEHPYEKETADKKYRQYKPDFTIYYNVKGVDRILYYEHFGINANGNVAPWFKDYNDGTWETANRKYNNSIFWKKNKHSQYGTTLIYTTSAMFADRTWQEQLTDMLLANGVPMRRLSDQEIYNKIVRNRKAVEETLIKLIISFISLLKSNLYKIDDIIFKAQKANDERSVDIIKNIILPVYERYNKTLKEKGELDFTDLIIQATNICSNDETRHIYDHILIDEFQDISKDRYRLLQSLRKKRPLTKLFCVGDDWQSIYRFAGSDMELFNQFEKFFGYTALCKIETTHRFGEPLLSVSSNFILKNPSQTPKNVKNPGKETTQFIHQYADERDLWNKVCDIVSRCPNNDIYILGRYSFDYKILLGAGSPIKLASDWGEEDVRLSICGKTISFLTVHKSKGLEAGTIILLNCNSGSHGFPSTVSDDPVLNYLLSATDQYQFGEERRVFYVAITRAKNELHMFCNPHTVSPFISEIDDVPENERCPICEIGRKILLKEGIASTGNSYKMYGCTLNACSYSHIEWENNTCLTPTEIQEREACNPF